MSPCRAIILPWLLVPSWGMAYQLPVKVVKQAVKQDHEPILGQNEAHRCCDRIQNASYRHPKNQNIH